MAAIWTPQRNWTSADRLGNRSDKVSLNTHLRDNMDYLKGAASVKFGGGYKLPHMVREVVLPWQKTLGGSQVAVILTGAGAAVANGGTGQVVLTADAGQVGTARVDFNVAVGSALATSFSTSNTIVMSFPFGVSNSKSQVSGFLGLRETPSGVRPAIGENSFGFDVDGTTALTVYHSFTNLAGNTLARRFSYAGDENRWYAATVLYAPGTADRRVEFWMDAALNASIATSAPKTVYYAQATNASLNYTVPNTAANLTFSAMILSVGGGAGTTAYTLGNVRIQEYA